MLANLFKGATASLPKDTAAQFYAGYLWAVKEEDKRDEIVACFANDSDLNDMLLKIMDASKEGRVDDAKQLWKDSESHWETALKGCDTDSIYTEFKDLDKFTKDVMSRDDIDDYLNMRYTEYKNDVDSFSATMLTLWDQGVYFNAGMYDGYIAQRMGLVESPYNEELEDGPVRDLQGPAQFLAGWLYGISDQTMDKRDDIIACFTPSHDLMKYVYHAMNQYIKGNKHKGDEAWEKAIELYEPALAECDLHSIKEPLHNYRHRMSEMVADKKWSKKEHKIYEAHKDVIDEANELQFKTWWEGVPFDSGMFAGRIDAIFLDNFKPSSDEATIFHPFM